jgi:hypothetical protein
MAYHPQTGETYRFDGTRTEKTLLPQGLTNVQAVHLVLHSAADAWHSLSGEIPLKW